MNLKTIMPLGLAIVLGLVAAFVAKNALSKRNANPEAVAKVKIIVAKRDISPGKQLSPEDVTFSEMPGSVPPPGTYNDFSAVAGRVACASGIAQGLPITEPVLAAKGTGSGLQALIPPGMRAVTIDINETTGLAGMVQPGCMVDVVTTLRTTKGDTSVARTVVQNVKVTAVGNRVNPNPSPEQAEQGPARSVTLLVTPKDAAAIELAASIARPRLVLRSNQDGVPVVMEGVTLADLLGEPKEQADPFTAPVKLDHDPVKTEPTTKPAQVVATSTPEVQPDIVRNVTVIRAGAESSVKFRMPRAPRSEMSDSPTQSVIEQ
jgi:pilus assembly protein CpaB